MWKKKTRVAKKIMVMLALTSLFLANVTAQNKKVRSNQIKRASQIEQTDEQSIVPPHPVETLDPVLVDYSLSFRQYLNEVGKNNLEMLGEKYNVKIAEAEQIASKVMPDPQIEIETEDESYKVMLGYTLEFGNKRGARVRLAKSETELSKLEFENFFRELRAEATDAYLEAMLQQEMLKVKRSSYEYMVQLNNSDSIRLNLGEISVNDMRQTKVEAATLLTEVYQQEADYKASLAVLNFYMGKDITVLPMPNPVWGNFNRDYNLSALIETAKQHRADLLAAEQSSKVAMNELKLAKAERKMDIELAVGYEREWGGYFPKNKDALRTAFTIPLMFSNFNKGAIRAANYSYEQSLVTRQNVELSIQTEVIQAYHQYEATKKQMSVFNTGLLEDAKKVMEGMVYSYNRGESDIMEVLIAQRTYNEVQEQYLETLKGYAEALVNLETTCGIWDIDF